MSIEEKLLILDRAGYHDVSFIHMPNGDQYRLGRTPTTFWVCQTEPYPGDPEPFFAWGKTREEAADQLIHLVLQLHPA